MLYSKHNDDYQQHLKTFSSQSVLPSDRVFAWPQLLMQREQVDELLIVSDLIDLVLTADKRSCFALLDVWRKKVEHVLASTFHFNAKLLKHLLGNLR